MYNMKQEYQGHLDLGIFLLTLRRLLIDNSERSWSGLICGSPQKCVGP